MSRDIDARKIRKALRRLRRAKGLAESGQGPPLSDWEEEFLASVEERIETYGSAFNDPEKGHREEPLSALQSMKVREIEKKAKGKAPSGFGRNKRPSRPDHHSTTTETTTSSPPEPPPESPPQREDKSASSRGPDSARPRFRVIDGGKS